MWINLLVWFALIMMTKFHCNSCIAFSRDLKNVVQSPPRTRCCIDSTNSKHLHSFTLGNETGWSGEVLESFIVHRQYTQRNEGGHVADGDGRAQAGSIRSRTAAGPRYLPWKPWAQWLPTRRTGKFNTSRKLISFDLMRTVWCGVYLIAITFTVCTPSWLATHSEWRNYLKEITYTFLYCSMMRICSH